MEDKAHSVQEETETLSSEKSESSDGHFIPADSSVCQEQFFTVLVMAEVEPHHLGTQVFHSLPTYNCSILTNICVLPAFCLLLFSNESLFLFLLFLVFY